MIGEKVMDNCVKPLIFMAFGRFARRARRKDTPKRVIAVKLLISKALAGFARREVTPRGITAIAAVFMSLIFMASGAFAQPHPAIFLGLMNEKGEPVQAEMEQALRNALAANKRIKLADKLETQRIVREKERLGRSNVENFIPPGIRLDSTTVIIKGIVQDPEFKLKRHWLIWGKIESQITVKFHFEELFGTANYQGEYTATAMKTKEVLFFASARKNIHISASDREGLLGEMQSKLVKEISTFATTFFNALTINDIAVDVADADTLDTTDTAIQENESSEPEPTDSSEVKAVGDGAE